MIKKIIFFCSILILVSCQQKESISIDPMSDIDSTQLQLSDVWGAVDQSILDSDWWKALNPTTQKLIGLELMREGEPLMMTELDARMQKVQSLSIARAKGCPSFPTGNVNGDVKLNSQADVNAFAALKCKQITGALEIIDTLGPDPICDLTPLLGLKEVGSSLTVNSDCLTSLAGLDKVKSIGKLGPFGFVGILGLNLVDIEALSKVSTITGSINIIECDQLTSVTNAFSKIITIDSGKTTVPLTSIFVLNINGNDLLTDLSAFNNLSSIAGGLRILTNGALLDLNDFISLNNIGDDIFVVENTSLQNVNQLSIITSLKDDLFVFENPALTQCCGLYNLLCNNPPSCTANGVAGNIAIFNNGAGCTDLDIIANGQCP